MSETKNQELPPHGVDTSWNDGFQGEELQQKILEAREDQLLAAIAENELLRSYKFNADHAQNLAIVECLELRAESKAKDARLAYLEKQREEIIPALCASNDRCKAAESRLRAVSEALKDDLPMKAYPAHGTGMLCVYAPEAVAGLVAKIRAIVEGKC